MDGKPASLLQIVENSGDDKPWVSFLNTRTGVRRDQSADRYLKSKLGDYLSTHDVGTLTGIKPKVLENWRKRGTVQSTQLRGRWYYSVESLLAAIKSDFGRNRVGLGE